MEELCAHALRAVRVCSPDKDAELTAQNCTLAVVGVDRKFTIIEDADLEPYVKAVEAEYVKEAPPPAAGAAGAAGGAAAGGGAAAAGGERVEGLDDPAAPMES